MHSTFPYLFVNYESLAQACFILIANCLKCTGKIDAYYRRQEDIDENYF